MKDATVSIRYNSNAINGETAPAHPYYQAMLDDMDVLNSMYNDRFRFPAEACILMAKVSEEMLRTKLNLRGVDIGNEKDQCVLLSKLGFEQNDPVFYTCGLFNEFMIMGFIPYEYRKTVTVQTAMEAYEALFDLIDRIRSIEPIFPLPARPVKKKGFIGSITNY